MKIPTVLAQAEIPVVRGAGPSPALVAAPYQALASAGEALVRVGETVAKVEQATREQDIRGEVALLGSQVELEAGTLLENLKTTETDRDTLLAKYRQGVSEIQRRVTGQAKNRETGQVLARNLARPLARHALAAQRAGNDLYVSRQIGALDDSLANRRTAMSLLDPADEEGWVENLMRGGADIQNSEAILGPKETAERRRKWKDTVLSERAHQDLRRDPEGTSLERYRPHLLPETYDRLLRQQETLSRAVEARRRRYEDDLDKQLTTVKRDMVLDLDRAVATASTDAARAAVLADLEFLIDVRKIDDADARRIRQEIAAPRAAPSTPRIASFIGLDVQSITPTTNEAHIDFLHQRFQAGGEGLNLTDAIAFKSRLRETREGLASTERAKLRDRHQQAEQELRAILGIRPGIIESALKDDPIARLYGQGMGVLRARSAFYSGKEDPLDIINEIRPQYIQAAGQAAAMKANEILPTLIRPTRQALQQAYGRGQISRDLYVLGLSQFDRLKALGIEPGVTPPAPPPSGSPGPGRRLGAPAQ